MTAADWAGHTPTEGWGTSEARLLKLVTDAATGRGLLIFHSTDSRRDLGRGWPDLVIASRTGRIIFAELKNARGHLDPHQITWRWVLLACGLTWYLWRPADWDNGAIGTVLDQLAAS